jgi:hypothetical protein
MKRLLFLSLVISMSAILPARNVYAHVVTKSEKENSSAVIHITPGDDPIVGKESTIYIDIGKQIDQNTGYVLKVVSGGATTNVPVTLEKTSVVGKYTFPKVGDYTLLLSSDTGLLFSYTQTVSRTSSGSNTSMIWLFLTIVASIVVLSFGVVLATKKYKK